MARTVNYEHREALIDQAVDYVMANGIADLALRPLAAELDTHAPVLLHHFGSRDQLVVEILRGVRDRLRTMAREATATQIAGGFGTFWMWLSDPERDAFFRTFFECYSLALRRPDLYAAFLDTVVRDWLEELIPPLDEATATIAIAAMRGLLLDLLATGDRDRLNRAAARLEELLRPASHGPAAEI